MIKKINYENKVSIQNDEEIKRKNKVTDEDMNEIKEVVNINAEELEDNKRKVDGLVDRSRGYSAYEIAVFEGFNGTKEEWLESLKGDKGDKGEGIVPDLVKTATDETIYLTDSAEMRFKKFGIGGNSKQETRSGKNLFDNTKTPNQLIGATTTKIDTGVRITSINAGVWTGVVYAIKDLSSYVGKEVRAKTTMTPNGDNIGYLGIGICSSTGDNRTAKGTIKSSGETKFTIPNFTDSNTYLYIALNSNSTGTGVEGSYVDYTNLIITIDNEDTSYEPYGAMPSPDYQSEVESCGDNINLFDKDNASVLKGYISGSTNTTTFGTTDNSNKCIYIPCKPNKAYTVSKVSGKRFRIATTQTIASEVDINKTNNDIATKLTIISRKNDKYLIVYYYCKDDDTLTEQEILNSIKIVEGTETGEYSPYGQGCINEVICNKNIFNLNKWFDNAVASSCTKTLLENGVKIDFIEGTDAFVGHIGSAGSVLAESVRKCLTKAKPSTKYTISLSSIKKCYIGYYDKNYISLGYVAINTATMKFTTPTNTKYISLRLGIQDSNYTTYSFTDIQIEEGTTATDYIPHEEQTYPIPTQQPFRAIGDYRDTFIKKNNKWYERHPVIRKIFDGTENWFTSVNSQFELLGTNYKKYKDGGTCISSHFIYSMELDTCVWIGNSSFILIRDTRYTNVNDWKSYLAEQYANGTPVYVDYIAETPIDIECTPEQNEILDKIEQEAHTYKNVTHIYSTDEVKPVKDVEYYTDTQMNETFAKIQEMEGLKKDVNNFKEITVNVAQFGAVGNGITDDTEAIQNAINNAGFGGTVEFEKGKDYLVSSTIFVGIGQTLNFNFSNITPATDGTFTNNYVFSINSSDVENWDNAYSSRTTIINKLKADNINLIENLKLMYAPCNLKINWLFSRRFYGSVDSGNFYADMYELNDIYIYDNFGDNYAIYKRGQGDAFVVNKMLIGVFLDNSNMNAISVGSTAGCQLNDVIGGNYSFYNSRSVSINNAHIEVGRIVIKNSQVEINNSYLWKDGTNSTIEISDSAVANSKDINFPVVLNNVIFKIRNIKYTYSIEHGDIDISNFNGLLELNNVMRVNEIDSNNYFYESITGISIKTATDTYINTVDNKTCIRNKVIEPVRKIFTTLKSGYYTLTNCSTFESDRSWQGTAGKEYFYKVLVLNDTKRMCGINETNVTSATVKSATPTSTQNVLLSLGKVAGMSLRILRGSALNTFEEYVDIPFCQSRVLVDTGTCINGFKWKTNSSGTYPTINNIFSEDFITNYDGNVHCFGKEKPTVGTWKAGDIVYDITGTTMGWRCTTDGTPGTWVTL